MPFDYRRGQQRVHQTGTMIGIAETGTTIFILSCYFVNRSATSRQGSISDTLLFKNNISWNVFQFKLNKKNQLNWKIPCPAINWRSGGGEEIVCYQCPVASHWKSINYFPIQSSNICVTSKLLPDISRIHHRPLAVKGNIPNKIWEISIRKDVPVNNHDFERSNDWWVWIRMHYVACLFALQFRCLISGWVWPQYVVCKENISYHWYFCSYRT